MIARRLFVLLACLFLLAASREPPWGDAHVSYDTARAIVERGALDVSIDAPDYFFVRRAGKKYGFGALGNALAHVPSYWIYRTLGRVPGVATPELYAFTSHLSSALLMAGACALFFLLALRRGAAERLAVLLTLALGLGTIAFPYARSPYSEALQTFALLLAVERALAQGQRMTPRGMAGFGGAAGLLLDAKLVHAAVLPLLAAHVAIGVRAQAPSRRALRIGVAAAAAAFLPFLAIVLFHNTVLTGSPFRTGYGAQSGLFSGEALPALYGYLFSTGQGMFLFSPPLVLGLLGLRTSLRERRRESLLLLSVIAVVMLLAARFRVWHGGYAWGPRYLAPLTPLVLLLALPWLQRALDEGRARARRILFAAVVGSGVAVQLLGASLYWDHWFRVLDDVQKQTGAVGWSQDHLPHGYFVPHFSPIRGHLWLLSHLVRGDAALDADAPWRQLIEKPIDLRRRWEQIRIDWWLLDWLAAHGARPPVGLAIAFALAAGAGLATRSLRLRSP